jgi:hypothetical protein
VLAACSIRKHGIAAAGFDDNYCNQVLSLVTSECLINEVVSMGRRNTGPKSNLQVCQWLNSFESADSKKTLPCLGLIEYSPKDRVALKNTIGSTD